VGSEAQYLVGVRTLIGRDRELTELALGLDETLNGRGGVSLISGEPGIGKSRMVEAVAGLAEERGMEVHWGRCWEAGGAPAYWPWIQVLRSILATSEAIDLIPAKIAAQLVQVLPELSDRLPGTDGPAQQLEPEQAVFALMDAIVDVLRRPALATPVVVLLEDFHAADLASVTLLDFVGRQARSMPLRVVATFREADARRGGIGEVLAKMARGERSLRLARWSEGEVAGCIRATFGVEPGPRVISAIHEASEGNPLFVVEIADLMRSRGELENSGNRVDVTIPDSVRAVIRERAAGLNGETRRLLDVASIIGREFRAEEIAELVGTNLDEVENSLAEAATLRIIERSHPDGYRFAHALICEVFHSNLTDGRRRELHLLRADLLQQRHTEGHDLPWSELAFHLLQAGAGSDLRAMKASIRAAEQAMAQLAFEDASELLEQALIVFERLPDRDPVERCGLMLDRAQALLKAGKVTEGREICCRAAENGRRLENPEVMARAALLYGSVFVYADVDATLLELLREALATLEEGDSAIRARLQARLAAAMQPAKDPEEAMKIARDAIAMARRVGERETLLHAIRAGCSALMDLADPAERLALNREHVALAGELGAPHEALRGYMRIVIDAVDLGDPGASDATIEEYDRLASQTGLPHHQWPASSFRAMRAILDGRFTDADRLSNEAWCHAEHLEDPNAERTIALQSIGLARAREDLDEMRRAVESARTRLQVSPFTGLFLRILEASNLARMERLDEVPEATLGRLTDEIMTSSDTDRSIMCPAAEIVAAFGHSDAAESLFRNLEPFAENWLTWGLYGMVCEGPISRHLALLASSLGRTEEAERYFERALGSARKHGALPIVARTCFEFARHLEHDGGASALISELLKEAADTAADLGQAGLLDLIRAMSGGGDAPTPGGADIVPTVASFSLERDGEIWLCSCGGEMFSLKNTKGVRILARLVEEPGREFHVLDLAGSPADQTIDVGDAGEVLDATAKAQYQKRLKELEVEIEEAEAFDDPGRAARARDEIEFIAGELSKAFGLGGRERRSGSAGERARVNVQRRLRDAVRRVSEQNPAAGQHLDWALKTGMYCIYDPS
jgi:tetratricopeptide (TPR) repeat protein